MQQLLQHFFGKTSLADVPVESVRRFTEQFPSFAAGHYFLLQKLQEMQDATYPDQLQKTLVYFSNPVWLQYMVQHTVTTQDDTTNDRHAVETGGLPALPAGNSAPSPSRITLAEENATPPGVTHLEQTIPFEKGYPVVVQTSMPLPGHPAAPASAPAPEPEAPAHERSEGIHVPVQAAATPEQPASQQQTVQQEEPFAFQSYHTIDYFASQGIKLSVDVPPDDKLGKQLKSFTEWLRTMRRLPQATAEEVMENANNENIEQFAAHSLEEKEIVTEAMAEVLVKQGKFEKARDVYRKLSLLNPQKSAYFTAKSKL